jgi:hypothetical protein
MEKRPRPNPQPHRALTVLDDSAFTRNLHCRLYDDCLEVAESQNWPGFTCSQCRACEPQSALSEKRDHRGLLRAAVEILHGDIRARELLDEAAEPAVLEIETVFKEEEAHAA